MLNKNHLLRIWGEKKLHPLLVIAMFILLSGNSLAQVIVNLRQPPPFQFKLEHMWKVTLINPTGGTYKVYLRGEATELKEGRIITATSAPFLLTPGVKNVNPTDLVPMKLNISNQKYNDVIQNIGVVPTGDYEICVTVIEEGTGAELGKQCISASTQNLTQIELIQPEDRVRFLSGANIGDDFEGVRIVLGSFITFSWMPPSPLPAGLKATYEIRISEIYGNQSPYDALLSNPAFYVSKNIYSNIFMYPVQGRQFAPGRRYAWKVTAYINNVPVSESESREFSYAGNRGGEAETEELPERNQQLNKTSLYTGKSVLVASTDNSFTTDWLYNDEDESETEPFLFKGNAQLNFEAGYKKLPFSELPQTRFSAELNPSAEIYGLPFLANFLYTTEQGSERQSINSFSFSLDVEGYKEKMSSRLEDKVTELATGWEKMLLGVNAFGIGTNYPTYTDFTLSGVPVTGVNFEFNPGIFYSAFVLSNNQRSITNIAYQRSIYAGRLGIGKKDESHFILTGLYAKDDENSITPQPENLTLTPKANYVLGAHTRLTLFDEFISIEGEGDVSVLTRDVRDPSLENEVIPSWIKGILEPRISTSFDYSYSGKMLINNPSSATKVSFGLRMTGPGYVSLGVPNLRNDLFTYEAKIEQGFLTKKISVGGFFRSSYDNLIDWKSSRTTTTAFGVNLGVNIPQLPFLQISYTPYIQKNNDTTEIRKVENKTYLFSAITGYTFPIEGFNFSTIVAYSGNDAVSLTGFSDYHTSSISVTEAITFDLPISFTGTWGLINTRSPLVDSDINNLDFSVSESFIDHLSNTAGYYIAYEWGLNEKTGIYLNSALSVWEKMSINLRLEGTSYKDIKDDSQSYSEFKLLAMLSVNL